MDTMSNQLVAKYLSGDESALEKLVHMHLSSLYSFVFSIVREKEMAEDIVQETFIKAWKHLARFDQNQKFKTWLYAIAKNTAFDFLKKKKAIPFSTLTQESETWFENYPDNSPEILEELSRKETAEQLNQALGQIPELYRALLILVYREDFDLKEAALILGKPYSTIKSRHQRGIQKLTEIMRGASKLSRVS